MSDIIVGKHVLESLSLGMYSNPFDIFREYIQNSTDSIKAACESGLLNAGEGEISFSIDNSGTISIRDNGIGVIASLAIKKLRDIGNSDKDYLQNQGFRGIGRLGGLGYADSLIFKTSALGEDKCTIVKWDCIRMRELLSPSNSEYDDVIGVIEEVTEYSQPDENPDAHYFEVILKDIREPFRAVYTPEQLDEYLSAVAPIDFDGQKFPLCTDIKEHFANSGYPIPTYNIRHVKRNKPIYKLYSRSLTTGMQQRTQTRDYVKSIEFVSETAQDGQPLYIGWLAITDFSGQIKDEKLQGIRLRKGNILIGDNTTFARFFSSEGAVANKMFAGEVHILHPDIMLNTKRDDFEPGKVYFELFEKLRAWADHINRTYRRGTSKVSSALRTIEKAIDEQKEIEMQVRAGAISSDTKRDKFITDLNKVSKTISAAKKELDSAVRKGAVDPDKKDTVTEKIKQASESEKATVALNNQIVNADYATKSDLPTSYSKDERKVYQRIIEVIDNFFLHDPDTANLLREAIKSELSVKKK